MPTLPTNPSLRNFQDYVAAMIVERGFTSTTASELFQLLLEECGELAKAARKSGGMHVDPTSHEHNIAHEAADVFIFLLQICNQFNVDLEQAFLEKEALNKKRTWTK